MFEASRGLGEHEVSVLIEGEKPAILTVVARCPDGLVALPGNGSCGCASGHEPAGDGASPPCEACTAGKFKAEPGADSCRLCRSGTAQPLQGATACVACESAKFAASMGQEVCEQCAAGRSSLEGADQCYACDAGTYAEMGMACTDCPAGR